MCTRYRAPQPARIERLWGVRSPNEPQWPLDLFPRSQGPFLRLNADGELALVVGSWGLIPSWSASPVLKYSTCNCRSEEAGSKPSFRDAWRRSQRCIIPAESFFEPCWESGRNVWWQFHRADGEPWGLAGLWNTWCDRSTGETMESYTMLTVNADHHPIMNRMHKPDPRLPADRQNKRSVVAIESENQHRWLAGSIADATVLLGPPAASLIQADCLMGRP